MPFTSRLPDPSTASLFLDFDGTLVDIAPTPDSIIVPADLPDLLHMLSERLEGRLALVSGRAIASLERHLPAFQGLIVGGHGAELRAPGGAVRRLAGSARVVAAAQEWATCAAEGRHGVLVELKQTGAAVHFRQGPKEGPAILAQAREFVAGQSELAVQEAHLSVELRPKGATKDRAVRTLMQEPAFRDTRPVFAGDDKTDVPAMGYCQDNNGIAISLGGAMERADIAVGSPASLRVLLEDWIA